MNVLRITRHLLGLSMFLCMASCDTLPLECSIGRLEKRVAEAEAAVGAVNGNAVAISALYKDAIAIVDVTMKPDGYTLELSDGTVINVVDGIAARGDVPIVGVDKDGNWIVSADGGETFDIIEGAENAFQYEGVTPMVRVGADGFWEYSVDGGSTWSQIMSKDGEPVSAVDGKQTAGRNSFFEDIVYNEGDDFMVFVLADGNTFSVPVEKEFVFEVKEYEENASISLSETLSYEVEAKGVKDVAIVVPEGWTGVYAEQNLSITAPDDGEQGEYEVTVIAVSSQGYLRNLNLTFTLK